MPLIEASRRGALEALSRLHFTNPFLEERIALERRALGREFRAAPALRVALDYATDPNLAPLGERIERETGTLRERLAGGQEATGAELALYEDLVLYLLYRRYREDLEQAIRESSRGRVRIPFWDRFQGDCRRFLGLPGRTLPSGCDPARLLADAFQFSRALSHIFNHIVGSSARAARLRAAVWQSIFTHDLRRYRRSLYRSMGDLPTLITGPSGTGKELVARAIALSRYIPFDPRSREFAAEASASFLALNLSALAPTLVESELFGHRKGAFTGALDDRKGWLEQCGALGSVFLDEIGDLDPALQLKLLRVLQERSFQRLGESRDLRFEGKVIAATHRDLGVEMRARRFRQDLYFRLCADRVATPSLREQLDEAPGDLGLFVRFIARRVSGMPEGEVETLAAEVEGWVRGSPALGPGYPWPGNFRELEQCVRNVMVRKEYHPAGAVGREGFGDPRRELADGIFEGGLSLGQLERRYCTLVYAETRDYVKAAERLKIDRRTLKSKIDPEFLERIGGATRS